MAGIVEDLRRIPMSPGLTATLTRAATYAQAQSHPEVALEHLLLALTEDDDAAQVLDASHVDSALLKADVSQFLGGLDNRLAPDRAPGMTVAPDLRRILEAAAAAATQGKRSEINGAIVLAAIVGDGRSSAAHMLRAQGLTFEEAIKALQRALAAPPSPKSATPQIDAEDTLASARARVQTRTVTAPPPTLAPIAPPAPVASAPEPVATAPAWPPEVRTSTGPMPATVHDDFTGAARDGEPMAGTDGGVSPFEAARPPYQPVSYEPDAAYVEEPAEAVSYAPVPPPLPANPGRAPRVGTPQPGNRWPAPVSPAWRDPVDAPPPLPYQPSSYAPPDADAERAAPSMEQTPGDWQQAPQLPPHPFPTDDDQSVAYEPWSEAVSYPPEAPHAYEPPPLPPSAPSSPEIADWRQAPADPAWGPSPDTYAYGPELTPMAETGPLLAGPPRAPDLSTGVVPERADVGPATGGAKRGAKRRKKIDVVSTDHFAENIPKRMRVSTAVQVDVRLSKPEFQALADSLTGGPVLSGADAEAPALSVRLRAPDGAFLIDPAAPETQWLIRRSDEVATDFVSWRWTVTPLTSGRQDLQLDLSMRTIAADGMALDTKLPDQTLEIRVSRRWARGFGRIVWWMLLLAAGGAFAKFGGVIYEPAIAAFLKLVR